MFFMLLLSPTDLRTLAHTLLIHLLWVRATAFVCMCNVTVRSVIEHDTVFSSKVCGVLLETYPPYV